MEGQLLRHHLHERWLKGCQWSGKHSISSKFKHFSQLGFFYFWICCKKAAQQKRKKICFWPFIFVLSFKLGLLLLLSLWVSFKNFSHYFSYEMKYFCEEFISLALLSVIICFSLQNSFLTRSVWSNQNHPAPIKFVHSSRCFFFAYPQSDKEMWTPHSGIRRRCLKDLTFPPIAIGPPNKCWCMLIFSLRPIGTGWMVNELTKKTQRKNRYTCRGQPRPLSRISKPKEGHHNMISRKQMAWRNDMGIIWGWWIGNQGKSLKSTLTNSWNPGSEFALCVPKSFPEMSVLSKFSLLVVGIFRWWCSERRLWNV